MVFVIDPWTIPRQLKSRLCSCKGMVDFEYDRTAKQSRCKICEGFPPSIARHCVGCGDVFLLSFNHPNECSRSPLCWDCLHDPLCADIIANHLPCGLNHQSGNIEAPRFLSKVKPFEWDGKSVFSFKTKDTLSVDTA